MLRNIKNLKTDEIVYSNLDIADVMYGADKSDDKLIVFLPDGDTLTFAPRDDYLVYDPVVDGEVRDGL